MTPEKNYRNQPGLEAGAALLQRDGSEIAAIVLNAMQAGAERSGQPLQPSDFGEGVGIMLASALAFARLAGSDETSMRAYVKLLRSHADAVEASVSPN